LALLINFRDNLDGMKLPITCENIKQEITNKHKLIVVDCHQALDSGNFRVAVSWKNQLERILLVTPIDCNREPFWEWLDEKVNALLSD
jgi:hypothetical protein